MSKEVVGDKGDDIVVEDPQEEIITNERLIAAAHDINSNQTPSLSPSSSQQGLQGINPLEGQVVMDEHGNPLRFTSADGGIFQVNDVSCGIISSLHSAT